MFLFVVTMGWF